MLRIAMALAVTTTIASRAHASESSVVIPTDPKATYTILEVGGSWPQRTITTRRSSPSGVTYSKRLFDCAAHTYKYLGTGDTLEAMSKSAPDPKMTPLQSYSIADFLGHGACGWD